MRPKWQRWDDPRRIYASGEQEKICETLKGRCGWELVAVFSERFRGCWLCLLHGWLCVTLSGHGSGVMRRKAGTFLWPWHLYCKTLRGLKRHGTPSHTSVGTDCSPIGRAEHTAQIIVWLCHLRKEYLSWLAEQLPQSDTMKRKVLLI